MSLCVQLGLHKEPPTPYIGSKLNLESQRRIFWTSYALDAQNHMLMGRLSGIYRVRISVQFPSPRNASPEQEVRTAVANYLYTWRQMESEITTGIFHFNCGDLRVIEPEWLENTRNRSKTWREVLDSRQFASNIEFRDLMYQFQRFRLNRISPRLPNPSHDMRRECIEAGTFIIADYCRILRQGNLFYWHHCCWHLFEIGIALVEAAHTGINLAWKRQETFLQSADADDITRAMHSIPFILRKMNHQWPQVERMVLELEEVFNHALPRLKEWVDAKATAPSHADDLGAIRKYFLGEAYEAQADVPCHASEPSAQITDPSVTPLGGSMTTQEARQMIQPETMLTDVSHLSDTLGSSISPTNPVRSDPIRIGSPNAFISKPNDLHMSFDIDSNVQDLSFWHGGGLELDDIFTAFNEGRSP